MWWDETIANWKKQGLPAELETVFDIAEYFGLDPYQQFWFSTTDPTIEAVQHHVEGIVSNMDDYLRVRPDLFPDHSKAIDSMQPWARRQADGEAVVWNAVVKHKDTDIRCEMWRDQAKRLAEFTEGTA